MTEFKEGATQISGNITVVTSDDFMAFRVAALNFSGSEDF